MHSNILKKIIQEHRYHVEDGIFLPEVIDELREYALNAEDPDDIYKDYYSLNFSKEKLRLPILSAIITGLETRFPFLGHFDRGWAFVYDNNAEGVTPHADPACYNVNLWVTPDSSVEDPEKNGLIIYDIKPPPTWTWREYNADVKLIRKYLEYTRSEKTTIPYAYNRLLIFNSKYFHETNKVSMRPGSNHRRVNYTFMFKTQ
jgi:hypothetical protein